MKRGFERRRSHGRQAAKRYPPLICLYFLLAGA